MFDIGFSELTLVAVVALIVLGPDRLPKAARTMGHLFGRLQRYVNDVKADISREMELDELKKLQQQVQGAAREIETSMTSAVRDFETGARAVEKELSDVGAAAAGAATLPPLAEPPAETSLPAASPPAETSVPAASPPAEPEPPARQASLPGFDRI
jgi:sec-independent protein translocase protein TatB